MVSPRLILNCKPLIPKSCFVHPSAVLAGNVRLGEKVSVWPNAVLRGDCELIQMYAGLMLLVYFFAEETGRMFKMVP
jgi:carbonic anhydrase/acetyltransferase-like protein (isoleucine patch superfamily)